MSNIKLFYVLCVVLPQIWAYKQVFKLDGNFSVAYVVNSCQERTSYEDNQPLYHMQTVINSAIWVTQRINYLEVFKQSKLGLVVYESCSEKDYLKIAFDLVDQDDDFALGMISDCVLNEKVARFCEVLNLKTKFVKRQWNYVLKATVKFLSTVGWMENVTVVAPSEDFVEEFFRHSKREFICLKESYVYGKNFSLGLNLTNHFVSFGNKLDIEQFLTHQDFNDDHDTSGLFVPLDGSVPSGLPPNSFVIIPPHLPYSKTYSENISIIPGLQLFESAAPIVSFVKSVQQFMRYECDETIYKINCVRSKFRNSYYPQRIVPNRVLEFLKIEPLKGTFVYNIFRVENDSFNSTENIRKNNFLKPFSHLMEYNIFFDNISVVDETFQTNEYNFSLGEPSCVSSFFIKNKQIVIRESFNYFLYVRTDSWVYAFLTISLLGIIFCITILIFLLITVFRGDILEGNPILTITLLLSIMLLFCAVLPFSLKAENSSTEYGLCLAKALSFTLSYALVFSLLLSRCILLATASKEIGFMSHIAGPVQSFLWLFIFGVQAALSIQIVDRCREMFRNEYFIFIMSYNTMLLLLLLCLTPLVYKCQRNYREVSTGSVFLGSIFIPRTYLMTIANARDKITSALPSLATATSAMDIYRASTQPIYDCVNVAAINAVNVARASVASTVPDIQRPDLYSCPTLPDDESFDFRCDTPQGSDDKVTRF